MKNKYFTIDKKKDKQIINIIKMPVLYKYQTINEHTVNALINNEVWGTVPTNFNDPYDMIFCYSISNIRKAIRKKLTEERLTKYHSFFQTKNTSISKAKPHINQETLLNIVIKNSDCRKMLQGILSFSDIGNLLSTFGGIPNRIFNCESYIFEECCNNKYNICLNKTNKVIVYLNYININ